METLNISFDTPQRQNFLKYTIKQQHGIFLGRGSFGCVFKASYKGKKVAVKVISKHDDFKFSSLKRERNILKLYHPNIIRILKIVETKESGAMIMERFTDGRSLQFVLDHLKKKLHVVDRLQILSNIGSGLAFCHTNRIIHRDLKPDNIMLVSSGNAQFTCKIFDFGCSYSFGEEAQQRGGESGGASNIMGTVRYSAPELLQGREPDFPVDIFAMGIVMWQLKENEIPYQSIKSNDIIVWQVVKNNLRPDSTLLLLAEMNESCRLNQHLKTPNTNRLCCKSDTLNKEELLLNVAPKTSLTPVSIGGVRRNSEMPRSDCKRDKLLLLKPSNSSNGPRSIRKFPRKNLFDCKSIDLLMNIESESEKEENASLGHLLGLFQNDRRHHRSSHEQVFHIENQYIQLYKACWHTNAGERPQIEDFCNTLAKFTDYLQD